MRWFSLAQRRMWRSSAAWQGWRVLNHWYSRHAAGGTGTNGQALNRGIVVDMSRHMNRILEINPEQGWVRVEAGVIKDQLNQYLQPFGFFFSPELSTSNRATLGGND